MGLQQKRLSLGEDYLAWISDEGALYTCGDDGYKNGRLCLGHEDNVSVLTLVQGALLGATVIHVSAGPRHAACITEQGDLYTWGYGRGGTSTSIDRSRGYEASVYVPTLVQGALLGATVIDVSAGYSHTAYSTEQGALYTWGRGKDG